jgi:endoglucanase
MHDSRIDRRKLLLAAGVNMLALSLAGCGGTPSSASAAPTPTPAPPPAPTPTPTPTASTMLLGPAIVVDQFGYIPAYQKVAVIRDPQTGFDASDSFTPGTTYEVVNATTNAVVFSGAPTPWNGGAQDASSGDKAWHFDFSSVTAEGSFFVRDAQRSIVSPTFSISATVYAPVLKAAVRYFFYQRCGPEKTAANAGIGWADGAAFVKPGQDKTARLYSAKSDPATERDVSGGWFDAGDCNKYTSWAAGYVVGLLQAYAQRPGIWTDDFNIPESGNGIPDIVDEAKWGLDWLRRMQLADGSVLSIVGVSGASPPSASTQPSYYGPANTSATLATAAAFAFGAKVLGGFPALASYAADLRSLAELAWNWADANPKVLFRNNDDSNGSGGLGAGQQETDDFGRLMSKLNAAVYLFDLTGSSVYRSFVDANYSQTHLIVWSNYVSPYEGDTQLSLLHYASLPTATSAVAGAIRSAYANGMESEWFRGKVTSKADPYQAYIADYIWGSNSVKGVWGNLFLDLKQFGLGSHPQSDNVTAAAGYLHYLHGVNPFGKVYLTNMYSLGATNSVNQIFHTWFADGSSKWDDAKKSTYGPPPGFLVGGPNYNQWDWDSRCPSISPLCGSERPQPPYGQPPQKSYKDFNDGWPLNSWPIAEVSNGYQVNYIRMLARLV